MTLQDWIPGTAATAVSTQPGISPATGQPGAVRGHVDGDRAVIGDVDFVDQAELVDVRRDLGIVDALQSGDDIVGQAVEFLRRDRRGAGDGGGIGPSGDGLRRSWCRPHGECRGSIVSDSRRPPQARRRAIALVAASPAGSRLR